MARRSSTYDIGAAPTTHRWTAAKLLKRVVIFAALTTAIVGSGAAALYVSTEPPLVRSTAFETLPAAWREISDFAPEARSGTAPGQAAFTSVAVTSIGPSIVSDSRTLHVLTAAATDAALSTAQPSSIQDAIATLEIVPMATLGRPILNPVSLYGSPSARLDRLAEAGFRGVVLSVTAELSQEDDTLERVLGAVRHANRLRPAFLVLVEGPVTWLSHTRVVQAIDGFVTRGLILEHESGRARLDTAGFESSRHFLNRVTRTGKPVLVQEWVTSPTEQLNAEATLRGLGFVPFVALRPAR
ncbi:MAG: hypothetical protein ACFCUN_00140 [Hyphomicrobiaceae bacterium]